MDHKLKSLSRFMRWQLGSRFFPAPVAVNLVDGARLLVSPGMIEAHRSVFAGLYEFSEMSFSLHLLREDELFVDVGANIGAYTVLAGAVVGAQCLTIEPVPATYARLIDNINLNRIGEKVQTFNIGIGEENRSLDFTTALDTQNHAVITGADQVEAVRVPIKKLDDVVGEREPLLLKIDVEGFETAVVAGARNVLSRESLLAVILELNGNGERYGYEERALHRSMIGYGFKSFAYAPLKRELVSIEGVNERSENTLYVRDVTQAVERVKSAAVFSVDGEGI
jgi:FkbM family methyltransferase